MRACLTNKKNIYQTTFSIVFLHWFISGVPSVTSQLTLSIKMIFDHNCTSYDADMELQHHAAPFIYIYMYICIHNTSHYNTPHQCCVPVIPYHVLYKMRCISPLDMQQMTIILEQHVV